MNSILARAGAGLVLAAAIALLVAMPSGAAAPGTTTAKSCSLSTRQQQSVPHGYLTSLSVHRTTCAHGYRVERAFQRCRKGRRGRCHHRVLGYKCRERRGSGPGVMSSSTTCRRGGASVHFNYSVFV